MNKQIFKTEFVNKRDTETMILFENSPSNFVVKPHTTFELETDNPTALYYPYSKVQYLRNGDVKVTERPNWNEIQKTIDYGLPYLVRFFNRDGSLFEGIYLTERDGRPTLFPKGIPRFIGVSLDSPYVKFKEYIWQYMLTSEKFGKSDYTTKSWGLKRVGIDRPKKELAEIVKLLKEREMRIASEIAGRNVEAYAQKIGMK